MRLMAKLKSGVILKLLEDMDSDNPLEIYDQKPVLLQIRGIVPVLEEGDLWPNRGFYLRVSDLTHAIYVSLPHNHDDMILSNDLKLGQYIYVQMLEKSEPVPFLRGITPVPGRKKCEGFPEDIISTPKSLKQVHFSEHDSIVEKAVISEEVIDDERKFPLERSPPHRKIRSFSASKVRPSEPRRSFDLRSKSSHDSDSDSNLSSASSTRISSRRSWGESEILKVNEIVNSSMAKHEPKPLLGPRSANASPIRRARHEISEVNTSPSTRKKVISAPRKLVKSTKTSTSLVAKANNVEKISSSTCCLIGDKKGAETGILWGSLPPNLLKLGKEIVHQRDIALLAAADSLQEACAAERLLNCLSTFSDFHLTEGDDLQPYVDKFFDLQDNLAQSRLITQSLTNISPLRDSETDFDGSTSIKDALNIAAERKKNAITWTKSAMAVDLSMCSHSLNPVNCSSEATLQAVKRSVIQVGNNKPKGPRIVKSHRQSDDISSTSTSDIGDHSGWTRGSTLASSADLATSLQDECRNLFLGHVEKYLDEAERKSSTHGADGAEIAGMLIKIKKVNDWLDNIVNKEDAKNAGCDGSSNSCHPEIEACRRVRNKIYDILLKHVERTAIALEHTS